MKKAVEKLLTNIADLFKVRSVITVTMTAALVYLMCGAVEVSEPMLALFSASYGATIAYFFTHKPSAN
ncbi:MAG: hypothetical protein EOM14_09310 [Clostridia bacterium]|nr:hypothetical protein [Clostridia bacterium]